MKLPSGDEAALLTRYSDVRQVLSDPRFTRQLTADDAARLNDTESGGLFNSEMSTAVPHDTDGHLRWRRDDHQVVHSQADGGAPARHRGDGRAAPRRDGRTRPARGPQGQPQYTEDETRTAYAEFVAYMTGHIEANREHPGDDLLSRLIPATDSAGERLGDQTLVAIGMGLLIAGHETTANLIGKMVAMLLSDRRRWERLLADRSLVHSAVEEVLRYDANLGFGLPRYITEDVEVAGTVVPKGTTVPAFRQVHYVERPDERYLTLQQLMQRAGDPPPA